MFSLPRSRQLILSALAVVFVVICVQLAAAQVDDIGDGETDPVKLFERGQNAHARNDLVAALALYEAALKLRPEFPEAEFQRGVALAALDRKADAEKAFTRAIELRKDWVLPYGALGNLLTHQSRDKEAEPFLRRALQRGAQRFEGLTPRECNVAALVARGCTDRDIARVLGIGFGTVRTHINRAMEKRSCANRAELAALVGSERLNS